MKQGRTLAELAQELDRQQNAKRDFIADTRQIVMTSRQTAHSVNTEPARPEPGLVISVNDHTEIMDIRPIAHRQIATFTDIPQKYYDRLRMLDPQLLAINVNKWLQATPKKRMVRTLDGAARAFLSNRYRRIDNYDTAQVILSLLADMPGCEIVSCEVTESRLYLKVVNHRLQREVKVGDIVEAGFVFQNSEVGLGSYEIAPLAYRLWCLNGAKINTLADKRRHLGSRIDDENELFADDTKSKDDEALLLKTRDLVRVAIDETQFDKVVERLRETTEQKIEGDPVKAIELTAKRLQLTEGERGDVLKHLIEGGDLSRYGVMQAVTRASQDVKDYDRASDLEAAGGMILELPQTDWKVIARGE